ncbi:UPF0158 family protein [Brevibacillus invocatus]|uniref:UPF0158 family protein n=1 Tax=Brevibacillus invocatus TaxID=173959 RepID=UPI00203ECA9F|nr:UPF0158 family protein [Brevibacillus invocatus]MCM3081745.1 UPF0158 family protein [Brevibacillus invocatus]MCM3432152.1 UPF0158 family protein [Brevibacillus invocatus]
MRNRKRKKSALSDHESVSIDQDDQFYFIAGYTEGGAPYGVTWEEYEAQSALAKDCSTSEGEPQMKKLVLTERQLQELIDTYDMHMDGIEHFLNIDNGEIVMINSFDMEDEDEELSEAIEEGFNEIYFRIPSRESHEGYMDMEDFADTVPNEKLRTKLFNVLSGGKKIFRRFKDALTSDARELDRYYKFVESRNKVRILEWLESINFTVIVGKDNSVEDYSV